MCWTGEAVGPPVLWCLVGAGVAAFGVGAAVVDFPVAAAAAASTADEVATKATNTAATNTATRRLDELAPRRPSQASFREPARSRAAPAARGILWGGGTTPTTRQDTRRGLASARRTLFRFLSPLRVLWRAQSSSCVTTTKGPVRRSLLFASAAAALPRLWPF